MTEQTANKSTAAKQEATPANAKKRLPKSARLVITGLLLGALSLTAYLAFWRANLKRFAVVREGVLIRSGQPTEYGLKYLVRKQGVKTILSLRQENDIIHIGALDGGEPSGRRESDVVGDLKATYLHWPMGGEAYWPWLPPKQFEEFFELFDNEQNLPVAVHCVAGRHRTGTLAALYRLEYDRWPIDRVLEEVHSFDFGEPIPVQLVNLRTYTPRPRPDEGTWQLVRQRFAGSVKQFTGYEDLMGKLAATIHTAEVAQLIAEHVEADEPFAMAIARRLIFKLPDTERLRIATAAGHMIGDIQRSQAASADVASAVAIVADFGHLADQAKLLAYLADDPAEPVDADSAYAAVVRGVSDRYTPNRLAYMQVLLNDQRTIPTEPPSGFRYCDLAVARMTAIVNERFVDELPPVESMWDRAVINARNWFAGNADAQQLTQRIPPIEHRMAMDALRLDQDGGDRFR